MTDRWIKTSIIAILADDELDDERDELHLQRTHQGLRALVVVVLLLHQVVHLVEIVSDLFLEVDAQGLDLAPHAVLVGHAGDALEV